MRRLILVQSDFGAGIVSSRARNCTVATVCVGGIQAMAGKALQFQPFASLRCALRVAS